VLSYDPEEIGEESHDSGAPIDAEFTVASGTPPASAAPPPATTPPVSEQPPQHITEEQAHELGNLIRESNVSAQVLLDRYQVKGVIHLPAVHFEDARRWLQEQRKALKRAPSFITRAQYDELAQHLQARPDKGKQLLAVVGVERWGLLPDHLYPQVLTLATKSFDLDRWQREQLGGKTLLSLDEAQRQKAIQSIA
jgi:hypothetical protein